ncbi:TolC family protein [Granulicella tundricola]|uniref:Outer membrane efflux protein n=1 Tax=Granulicella tundricola (strain ATCC BAA-1859 / DSM 23138 / MP5ACTX9) TaxID=1198114 RepID=E8WZV4_GRATM|nr:TolC family protein [Granulicella tundricola]ADW67765.1 outer membrane efflux protein [Granulicella tundricola MP5ACTX9]
MKSLVLTLALATLAQAAQAHAQAPQSPAAAYAASAAPAADPRKPPASKPGALTLQQVVEQARARNPTLLAAEANLRAVRAQEIQAGVRVNPTLGVNGTTVTLPNDGSEGNPPSYAVQVTRLFERGNKREYRLEDARATTVQTAAQLEDTARQTILQVKQAFTKMLIAKEALELSNANLADYRHEVEIANDRYKAGDIGKLDFERLDLQLGSFESDQANAEITLLQSSYQLQTLLGSQTSSPDFDVTGDIIPPILTQTQAELTQAALTRRPDYAAARAGIVAAEANARLAIANGTTDPTLEGEYDRSGSYNSFGFNVNIPLRFFDRNQGNKETARLQAESTRFTSIAARNQVTSDVDQAWVGYTRAKALSDRFGQHYLDESIDVLGIARFAYDHGGLALIDYLDALRDARSSTSDALNAYSQTWMAIHQLSAASATELIP